MEHPGFFEWAGLFSLAEVAKATNGKLDPGADPSMSVAGIRPLWEALPPHISFLDNRKYVAQLKQTRAGATG